LPIILKQSPTEKTSSKSTRYARKKVALLRKPALKKSRSRSSPFFRVKTCLSSLQ